MTAHLQGLIFAFSFVWASCAFSQPIIKVYGTEQTWQVRKRVSALLDELEVREGLHLTVHFTPNIPSGYKGITIPHPSPEPDKFKVVRILLDPAMQEAELLRVLAHEIVHVRQYVDKELVLLRRNVVAWRGITYLYSYDKHHQMPWEREAYRIDRLLAQTIDDIQMDQRCLEDALFACVGDDAQHFEFEYILRDGSSSTTLP